MTDAPLRPRVGALVIARRDGAVLLVKRTADPHRLHWGFPGGGVEWGESFVTAALRELAEETGLTGHSAHLIDVHEAIIADPAGGVAAHWVLGTVVVDCPVGEPVLDAEASACGWFRPDAWPSPLIGEVDRLGRYALDGSRSGPSPML